MNSTLGSVVPLAMFRMMSGTESLFHFPLLSASQVGLKVVWWRNVFAMAMLTEEFCQRNSNHSPYISKLYI